MTPKLFVIDSANLETTNVSVEAILSRLNLSDYHLVRFCYNVIYIENLILIFENYFFYSSLEEISI